MKKIIFCLFFIVLLTQNVFSDILKVVDGDTIKINGKKIRFSGIDAPELNQNCIKNKKKYLVEFLQKKLS